jgi:hypothetical protein
MIFQIFAFFGELCGQHMSAKHECEVSKQTRKKQTQIIENEISK